MHMSDMYWNRTVKLRLNRIQDAIKSDTRSCFYCNIITHFIFLKADIYNHEPFLSQSHWFVFRL